MYSFLYHQLPIIKSVFLQKRKSVPTAFFFLSLSHPHSINIWRHKIFCSRWFSFSSFHMFKQRTFVSVARTFFCSRIRCSISRCLATSSLFCSPPAQFPIVGTTPPKREREEVKGEEEKEERSGEEKCFSFLCSFEKKTQKKKKIKKKMEEKLWRQ